ncbi:hypothetical protein G6F57_016368 [Rhizopus arrhizus]|nr:hypothetical protein G6F65_017508 [Rhizopus arrhizus]KAG1403289.1 hypothetical protein G6F59_012780 [Rhizopus arrhizus]KAG1450580.1 hypothetical protein G6F57_016368 [Rhizopus arrhizus]
MKFAEINFDPDDIALNDFLTNGLKFADNSIIIPCRALDSQMEVIRLRLSNLPFLSQSALLEVWNQMPHYCRYCHEEGHVVVDCPKRRARTSCWNCGIDGHMAASCTRDKPSKRARKQPETSVAIQPSVEEASTLLVTTEYPETTDAPTIDIDTCPNVKIKFIPIPSSTTVSPGKTGPKRSRVHATQKPYERPVTRSQSISPKESIYVPSGSVQVSQTDNMDTECSVDLSSSVTPTDEEPSNHMIQSYE